MIDITLLEISGFEPAIRGMRNPMNSWEKSDSLFKIDSWDLDGVTILDETGDVPREEYDFENDFWIGPNDLKLATKLCKAGSEHAKFRRMINVYVDILAPLYWWKEFDTYKVGTVANSCSTMHKIAEKDFVMDDFSHEHLITTTEDELVTIDINGNPHHYSANGMIYMMCKTLNHYRKKYLETKDKKYWWQMIQLLPSSYNQRRTVMVNYEVLANIYQQRKNHKLDEWVNFCKWIEMLPYAKEVITMEAISDVISAN